MADTLYIFKVIIVDVRTSTQQHADYDETKVPCDSSEAAWYTNNNIRNRWVIFQVNRMNNFIKLH